jgi:dipeptidyl aminopeptidase/acylaminoacyl peptidase
MVSARTLLAALTVAVAAIPMYTASGQAAKVDPDTRPDVAESDSPLTAIAPVAEDGHRGSAFLRKPPGDGPFPAVLIIHPGLTTLPDTYLREYMLRAAPPSRFLAAGYVVALTTYRSRDIDPQAPISARDVAAALDEVRKLGYVDADSVGLMGCSGGGDLALEIATKTDVAAIVIEEPASMMFTGVFNRNSPKAGERFTPPDSFPIVENPAKYYTDEYKKLTQTKITTLQAPVLLVQGDAMSPLNQWNAAVLVPELTYAGKQVIVKTYPGERHCFAWDGRMPDGTWRHGAPAADAFAVADDFFREHFSTQPRPLDAERYRHVALESH